MNEWELNRTNERVGHVPAFSKSVLAKIELLKAESRSREIPGHSRSIREALPRMFLHGSESFVENLIYNREIAIAQITGYGLQITGYGALVTSGLPVVVCRF